jgi:hypothetical protein
MINRAILLRHLQIDFVMAPRNTVAQLRILPARLNQS